MTDLPPGVLVCDMIRPTRGSSAPGSPLNTPPVSPQHWPRRASTLTKKPSSAQIEKPIYN